MTPVQEIIQRYDVQRAAMKVRHNAERRKVAAQGRARIAAVKAAFTSRIADIDAVLELCK